MTDKLKKSIKEKVADTAPAKTAVASMTADKNDSKVTLRKNENKKRISAYVDVRMYQKFQMINKNRGISNNAVLGMCIADYVNAYKNYL